MSDLGKRLFVDGSVEGCNEDLVFDGEIGLFYMKLQGDSC